MTTGFQAVAIEYLNYDVIFKGHVHQRLIWVVKIHLFN